MKLYKSMREGLKANHGSINFKVGEWYHQDGEIKACSNGFHASKSICEAMRFVDCEILAEVEVKGKSDLSESDKVCYSDMKITKGYIWDKPASVKLAIFAAEQVIDIFEKNYPTDNRPRKAIEAAKKWLKDPTEANRKAAYAAAYASATSAASASAAYAAYAAAATSAASASAAYAAYAASASAAAYASFSYASFSVSAKILEKCDGYIIKEIIPNLKEYAI